MAVERRTNIPQQDTDELVTPIQKIDRNYCYDEESIRQRPQVRGLMIDDPHSKIIEDAVWVEKVPEGRIGYVSVIDIVEGLRSHTDPNKRTRNRLGGLGARSGTTFKDSMKNNMPSLREHALRPTLTVTLPLTASLQRGEPTVGLTHLVAERQLSPHSAEQIMRGLDPEDEELAKQLQQLAIFTNDLKRKRTNSPMPHANTVSSATIGELVLNASNAMATFCKKQDIPVLFRRVIFSDSEEANRLRSSLGIAEALPRRIHIPAFSLEGGTDSILRLDGYVPFTSPNRNTADLANIQQILAYLNNEAFPYSLDDLQQIGRNLMESRMRKIIRDASGTQSLSIPTSMSVGPISVVPSPSPDSRVHLTTTMQKGESSPVVQRVIPTEIRKPVRVPTFSEVISDIRNGKAVMDEEMERRLLEMVDAGNLKIDDVTKLLEIDEKDERGLSDVAERAISWVINNSNRVNEFMKTALVKWGWTPSDSTEMVAQHSVTTWRSTASLTVGEETLKANGYARTKKKAQLAAYGNIIALSQGIKLDESAFVEDSQQITLQTSEDQFRGITKLAFEDNIIAAYESGNLSLELVEEIKQRIEANALNEYDVVNIFFAAYPGEEWREAKMHIGEWVKQSPDKLRKLLKLAAQAGIIEDVSVIPQKTANKKTHAYRASVQIGDEIYLSAVMQGGDRGTSQDRALVNLFSRIPTDLITFQDDENAEGNESDMSFAGDYTGAFL